MTRERKAQAITAVLLAAALAAIALRKPGPRRDPSPQNAVYAMLDAARQGNVRKYLDAYTGTLATALSQSVIEKTEPGFAQYLRDFSAPIKGIAINAPQPLSDRAVRLRVEFVYQDRNEVQIMYLEKIAGAWKIARLDSTERVNTLIPYGTPVQ